MYLKCGGGMSSAVKVLDRISEPNIITSTAMISGLAQNGLAVKEISFYRKMVRAGESENDYCLTSVLSAFGAFASLEHGKMAHCRVTKSGFCLDTIVGNTLLDMYIKCGSTSDTRFVFHMMQERDVVSWTAMMAGCRRHGKARKAIMCFREMVHEGFNPDSLTYLAVLSVCSQGDLVDERLAIFCSMVEDHHVNPQRENFACLVDLLAHAGRLKEAETLIRALGLEMDPSVWEPFLGACGIHGEVELGKRSAGRVMELEPWKYGPHVLLSNMYAEPMSMA
ncbi:unnamed protein product [Alopecurus aequalis]